MARNRQKESDAVDEEVFVHKASMDAAAVDEAVGGQRARGRRAQTEQAAAKLDWYSDAVAGTRHVVDSVLDMQQQWLKTASMGSETMAQELQELQAAKDPVEFLSAQLSVANQQMEILSKQVSAVLQQLYDAQLMWLGQWDEKSEEPVSTQSAQQSGRTALDALGQLQDGWLQMGRNWIDTLSPKVHH